MTRALRALAAILCLAGLPGLATSHPAAADPVGACTPTSGVIVAVDFGHWGGDVRRGCDATPTTGYDALHAAGFSTAGTRHDGPGFVCRIDDHPTPAEQACVLTPPSSAYWSYWHAAPGQDSWSYSNLGAQSYRPPPGSVDAWVYGSTDGGGGGPAFSPAAVRASTRQPSVATSPPRPTPTRPAGPATSTPAAGLPEPATSGAGQPTAAGRTPAPTATSAGPARRPSTSATAAGTTRPAGRSSSPAAGTTPLAVATPSTGPTFVDAAPAPDRGGSAGSPAPALLALAIAGVLAGGTGWAARRRRQRG